MNTTRLLSLVTLVLSVIASNAMADTQAPVPTPLNEMIKYHEAMLASGQVTNPQDASRIRWKLQRLRIMAQDASQREAVARKASSATERGSETCSIQP